jgi:hypothetical protein
LAELRVNEIKLTEASLLATGKTPSGQVVFLETGNSKAGLRHIIDKHRADFAKAGIPESNIANVVMEAVTRSRPVGFQGIGTGRPIYEIDLNSQTLHIAVTVSNNGFIVGANPARLPK